MRAPSPYHSTPDAVIRALQDARRLILAPEQWCRGRLIDGRRRCLEGALRSACEGDQATLFDCFRILRDMLGIPRDRIRSLFDWNDHPRVRHADVLAVLAGAAERADAIMPLGEMPA